MCFSAIAGLAAGGIQGGLSILGGNSQKKAAKKALDAQIMMGRENNALARENRNILTGYMQPYNQVGLNANNALSNAVAQGPYNGGTIQSRFMQSMNPGSFENWKDNTGFDFNMERGLKGIGIGAGAGGWLQSGAAIKGALDFGNNLQSRTYQDYRGALGQYGTYGDQFANQERAYGTDRYSDYINLLGSQQNVGLGAVNALAGVNNNATNQIIGSNNQMSAAQSNAALARGQANAGIYAGFGNALGNAAGMFFPGMGGYG